MKPRIGVSACFFHADPKRPIFKGKTLLYLEESISQWLEENGALPYLIPTGKGHSSMRSWVDDLDGLVLQGGSDISPRSYGEKPIDPRWEGDYLRDLYEMDLIREFLTQRKPILGVCRGMQVLNVALGGSLYQDIETQLPHARKHRDWEVYDSNFHHIEFSDDSRIAKAQGGAPKALVNTVHHQAVRRLGDNLVVEASSDDGIVEALRFTGPSYALGVQWHPEFMPYETLLSEVIARDFLDEADARKKRGVLWV
jgi:putative glutamine amidotransferase